MVYAANLVTDGSASALRLYRWANDAADTIPTVVTDIPELGVAERWGDTLDARGSGAGTQLLLASRSGRTFAVVSIPDGVTGSAKVYELADIAAGGLGLGLAFGEGNTVWGTAGGQPLVHASFDPVAGTAALVRAYPAALIPNNVVHVAVNPADKLLAAVALETPDNVQAYDLADLENPVLLDQELILTDKANPNGTGSADFGGGRLYVLNSNNGVLAYTVNKSVPAGPASVVASVSAESLTLTVTGTAGATYSLQQAAGLGGFETIQTLQIPPAGSATVTVPLTGTSGFFRVISP